MEGTETFRGEEEGKERIRGERTGLRGRKQRRTRKEVGERNVKRETGEKKVGGGCICLPRMNVRQRCPGNGSRLDYELISCPPP